MALRSEIWRSSEIPTGPLEPNWNHPFFDGASEAVVVLGGQPIRYLRNSKVVQPTATTGSMPVVSTSLGPAWSSQNAPSLISFGSAFYSRYSVLQICSGGWVRTCTFDNHYYGIVAVTPASVVLGNGGFVGPDARRSYSVAGSGTGRVIAMRPAAAITTAPTVYVDGQARAATYSSGNATYYDWNPSNATWEIGFDVGANSYTTGDRCELFVAVLGDPSDAAMAQATADPWSLFLPIEVQVPVSAGGSSWSVSLTESATASDAATAAYIANASVAESITAADSLAAATTWVLSLTEAATAAESVTTAGTFAASITESASAADALTSAVTWARALTEAASASDLATAIRHAVAALTEAATAADSQVTGSVFTRSLTESASVSDALTAAATLVSLLTEVATASDAASSAATWVRLLTEPATAVDSVAGAQGATYTASVTEVLAAAELLVAVLGSTEALGRYTITAKPRRLEIRK